MISPSEYKKVISNPSISSGNRNNIIIPIRIISNRCITSGVISNTSNEGGIIKNEVLQVVLQMLSTGNDFYLFSFLS